MEQFVYTGTSWAAQSFDPLAPGEIPDSSNVGKISSRITNLAREWGISHRNISKAGTSNLNRLDAFYNEKIQKPIVWIYGEPLADLEQITGLSKATFIARPDWKDIQQECNQYCLKRIADTNLPILLIGAASDVVDCNYNNITVINSWQKWLAEQAKLSVDKNTVHVNITNKEIINVDYCWSADIVHSWIRQNSETIPNKQLVESIWNIFSLWKKLEDAGLFYQVHPNYRSTELFAQYLKPSVEKFLMDSK
jgi:hypothetical protein